MNLTPEQKAFIDALPSKYLHAVATPIDQPSLERSLGEVYGDLGWKPPTVVYLDSPRALSSHVALIKAIHTLKEYQLVEIVDTVLQEFKLGSHAEAEELTQKYLDSMVLPQSPNEAFDRVRSVIVTYLRNTLGDGLQKVCEDSYSDYFYTYWMSGSLAFAEAASYLGVELDKKALQILQGVGQAVGYMIPYSEVCFVSHNPVEIHWEDNSLHCTNGPAVSYRDGFKVWALQGHLVHQQIVLDPKSQTLEEMIKSKGTLRRVRISQYGWGDFLNKAEAEIVDSEMFYYDSGAIGLQYKIKLPKRTSWDNQYLFAKAPADMADALEMGKSKFTDLMLSKYELTFGD